MDKYWVCFVLLLLRIRSSESVRNSSNSTLNASSAKTVKIPQPVATSRVLKVDDYHIADTIRQAVMHRPPSAPMNFQPQWFHEGANLKEGWFGFNNFLPRSASNMPFGPTYRQREAQMLGESTFMYPTDFYPTPPLYFDDNFAFHPPMNDLQSQSTIRYQENFANPHFAAFGQPLGGYLTSNDRPQQQQQHSQRHPQQHHQQHRHQQQRKPNFNNQDYFNFNYQRSNNNIQRTSSSAPMMIKIIPLKLSAIDISNALKSMNWIPIPLNLLRGNNNNNNNNNQNQHKDSSQQVYSDKRQTIFDEDEDESDLPPPSSHVATPPLGITYAEGQRTEHFVRFPNPK